MLHVLSQTLVQKQQPLSQGTGDSRGGGSFLRALLPLMYALTRGKGGRFPNSRLFCKPTTSSHSQTGKSCHHARRLVSRGGNCGGRLQAQGRLQQHIYSQNTSVLHVTLSVHSRAPGRAVTLQVQLFDMLIDCRVCHILVPSTTETPQLQSKAHICALTLSRTPICFEPVICWGCHSTTSL
jgi:hypothetical protein